MSDFWVGAFAALAVWELIQTLGAIILFGKQRTINRTTVAETFGLMVIFMAVAWYLATFGGGG